MWVLKPASTLCGRATSYHNPKPILHETSTIRVGEPCSARQAVCPVMWLAPASGDSSWP